MDKLLGVMVNRKLVFKASNGHSVPIADFLYNLFDLTEISKRNALGKSTNGSEICILRAECEMLDTLMKANEMDKYREVK